MHVCVYFHMSPDSVYVTVDVQATTHQTNCSQRSDPTLLNTEEEGNVFQQHGRVYQSNTGLVMNKITSV